MIQFGVFFSFHRPSLFSSHFLVSPSVQMAEDTHRMCFFLPFLTMKSQPPPFSHAAPIICSLKKFLSSPSSVIIRSSRTDCGLNWSSYHSPLQIHLGLVFYRRAYFDCYWNWSQAPANFMSEEVASQLKRGISRQLSTGSLRRTISRYVANFSIFFLALYWDWGMMHLSFM